MIMSSPDWVDSSGVRMYLTRTLRRFDGGVIELGLEYTDKMAIPPQQPAFALSGYCIAECTAVVRSKQFVLYIELAV
jgi:dopamine beta-monooxygenase